MYNVALNLHSTILDKCDITATLLQKVLHYTVMLMYNYPMYLFRMYTWNCDSLVIKHCMITKLSLCLCRWLIDSRLFSIQHYTYRGLVCE